MATAPDDEFETALGVLYAGDPASFTARRAVAVAELKAAGAAEVAARLVKARKPTAAASVINRFAHDHPDVIATLFELGAELGAAQRRALTGRSGDLRALAGRRNEVVAAVASSAVAEATAAGATVSASTVEEVRTTLDAALADETVAAAVAAGILERAAAPAAGFGPMDGMHAVADASADTPGRAPTPTEAAGPNRKELARQRAIEQQQVRVDRAASAARDATRTLDQARRAADALAPNLEAAERALREAQEAVTAIQRSVHRADHEVAAATRAHADAVAEVQAAEEKLDALTAEG